MDVLWLLVPLSAALVLGVLAVFGWAVWRGQFDDLEQEGQRILLAPATTDATGFDVDQGAQRAAPEQSPQA